MNHLPIKFSGKKKKKKKILSAVVIGAFRVNSAPHAILCILAFVLTGTVKKYIYLWCAKYAVSKGPGQTAHQCSLIRAFSVCIVYNIRWFCKQANKGPDRPATTWTACWFWPSLYGTLWSVVFQISCIFQPKSNDFFLISPWKCMLWVLIRSASPRRF